MMPVTQGSGSFEVCFRSLTCILRQGRGPGLNVSGLSLQVMGFGFVVGGRGKSNQRDS